MGSSLETPSALLEDGPCPRASTQNCTFFPIHRTTATLDHPGGCVGAWCPAQLLIPPKPTCGPSRQGHGSQRCKSLWLPLSCPGDTAQSPMAPTGSPSSLGMPGTLPGWSTGFPYMRKSHLPMSHWGWSWIQYDHLLLRSLAGEHWAVATPCYSGPPPAKAPAGRPLWREQQGVMGDGSSHGTPGWPLAPNILARPLED